MAQLSGIHCTTKVNNSLKQCGHINLKCKGMEVRDWVLGLLTCIICKGNPFEIVFKFHFDTHRLLEGLGMVMLVGVSVMNVLIVVPMESLLSMSF